MLEFLSVSNIHESYRLPSKVVTDYTVSFSPHEEKNDEMILIYIKIGKAPKMYPQLSSET